MTILTRSTSTSLPPRVWIAFQGGISARMPKPQVVEFLHGSVPQLQSAPLPFTGCPTATGHGREHQRYL